MTVEFIDKYKNDHGVEPICTVLTEAGMKIAPQTYYAARSRPPSARSISDAQRLAKIRTIHNANYGVYGARKMWHQLQREGETIARCTVERLMRGADLRGVGRAYTRPRTTTPGTGPDSRRDLVERQFTAQAPNQLWVADIERHGALLNRAVMEGHRDRPVAAGR